VCYAAKGDALMFKYKWLLGLVMVCVAGVSQGILFHGNYPRDHYCDVYQSHDFTTDYCYYPGSGPLLILMSDLGSNKDSWTSNFLKTMNGFAAVLVYNRPQYGSSQEVVPASKRLIGVDRIAQQLGDLLAHIKSNKKKMVLAYGAGGYYAQYFASLHPSQIDGMVLVNPMGVDKPCEDYKLYHVLIPAQRSVGYREFLGLQQAERKTAKSKPKKLLMSTVLVSSPSMLKSKKSKARWQKQQKKLLRQFKNARQVRLDEAIDEHSTAARQGKLIGVLYQMAQQLSS
jgi:pimeloyl-ACP methyl ester carboxylesterase